MDAYDIGQGCGGMKKAAAYITADLSAVGFSNDLLFPPSALEGFIQIVQRGNPQAVFHAVETNFSHDGFLVKFDKWSTIIKEKLEQQ